jgi:hypothetical protein
MSEHYVEIQFLYKKWRLIHRELAYTEVLAGPWYRRWAHELKESQAIGQEKRLFQNQNMIFKVPCHSLKKDIMALYGVHNSQIQVNFMAPNSTFLHIENGSSRPQSQMSRHSKLKPMLDLTASDQIIYLPSKPSLRSGLYLTLNLMLHFRQNSMKNIKILFRRNQLSDFILKKANEFGLEQQVFFLPTEDMHSQALAEVDLVLCPHLYDPLGKDYLIALAAGAQVVASKEVGPTEYFVDNYPNHFFDSQTTAQSLAQVLVPFLRPQLSQLDMRVEQKQHLWSLIQKKTGDPAQPTQSP